MRKERGRAGAATGGLAAQHSPLEICVRHRAAKEVALEGPATVLEQEVVVLFGLHPLGNHVQPY